MLSPRPLVSVSPRPLVRSRAAGFTLIEILVVVVILGIVSAIIVPQINSRDDLKASSAARALTADLIYAQNLAITRQQMIYVKFDAAAETYKVVDSLSPENVLTHPVLLSPFLVSLGNNATAPQLRNVLIDTASFDGQPIIAFDEMGVPYSVTTAGVASAMTAGSVGFICGTITMTVTIEPYTGSITIN
jgi:prepilin-type N-terminal cleavage/methylation domain-containing protein